MIEGLDFADYHSEGVFQGDLDGLDCISKR